MLRKQDKFLSSALGASLLLTTLLVAGCGGSSGSSSSSSSSGSGGPETPPAQPVLNLTPQAIKTFRFGWDDVTDASQYLLLENPDGNSGYTQVATIGTGVEQHDLDVFLPTRVNASYILEACNAAGCTASEAAFVEGTLVEAVGYFKASNTDVGDSFGYSLALSSDGTTLAVGAYREDSAATGIDGNQTDNSAQNAGAVYVFTRDAGVWSQQAYVKASNTDAGDQFGAAVALSSTGDTLAVGANNERSIARIIDGDQTDNSAPNAGAVYVFVRDAGAWSQQAYVKASNAATGDWFGSAVALSSAGDTLAVGAHFETSASTGIDGDQFNGGALFAGAVYVFTRDAGTWSQQAYVKASNTHADDRFGYAVALSGAGDTLAVGAVQENSAATGIDGDQSDKSAEDAGAVYVFTRDAGTWSQQAYVKASNTKAGHWFGSAVALSDGGDTLAVGALRENSAATGINGDQTGSSTVNAGAVYVFTRDAGAWSQQAYVKASNTHVPGRFGSAVALSGAGDRLAVGATGERGATIGIDGDQTDNSAQNAGAVYVFARDAGVWGQQSYVKASNTDADDWFGSAVALSGAGDTLAIGAPREDSAAGIGGDQTDNTAEQAGAVYLY